MDLARLEDLRVALRLAGLKPNRELGQNFLVDQAALELIIESAELSEQDTILEVGPGLGTMTRLLAARAGKVVAVEADQKLAELLAQSAAKNVEVIPADILKFDLGQLPAGYKTVSNIPYYLTSKIIRDLLEANQRPSLIVMLIQKEVAERICAKPGSLSILALSVLYYGQPEIVGIVGREKFWPAPEVDSAILKIRINPDPAFPADTQKLFRLFKAGFGEKRKMLKNSLAGGLNGSDELITKVLTSADIGLNQRAQELSLSDWEKLYNESVKHNLI